VTLVGNSLGGWLAGLVARERPTSVARLVLVNGGPLRNDRPLDLAPKTREEARALLAEMRDPAAPPVPGFVLDGLVELGRSGPLSRLSVPELETHLMDGHLGALTMPVELLWGTSDRSVPLSYAERLAKELPSARLTKLERCGHVPQVECPVRFAEALSKILGGA
jgi:pimeloyl-ACP methyl ester carboxylesterase